jgi:hypothetical protein
MIRTTGRRFQTPAARRAENAESAIAVGSPPVAVKPHFAEFWFCDRYVILQPSLRDARLPRTRRIFGWKPGNRGPKVVGANLAERPRVALLFRREPVS